MTYPSYPTLTAILEGEMRNIFVAAVDHEDLEIRRKAAHDTVEVMYEKELAKMKKSRLIDDAI